MLKIKFDIIKSKDEEYLDKVEPSVEILESDDLALQAWLLFFCRYKVPSAIRFNPEPLRRGNVDADGLLTLKFLYIYILINPASYMLPMCLARTLVIVALHVGYILILEKT
jgi:hypothetical protein